MTVAEFHQQTPVERHHHEIVVSGDRLHFDNEEYIVGSDGQLLLARSLKAVEQRLWQTETNSG